VKAGDHTVDATVRKVRTEERVTIPRQRSPRSRDKKGLFHRIFGG